ncbi:hypothetical protein F4861DRAFT_483349 [Xylaria intraflava]|nr:hypothetical protein F4861DRAFT_483349 [Xylaria intraflava]
MRSSKYELAGRELDTEMWNKSSHTNDWAYLDLLLSRMAEPSAATITMKTKRDMDRQARWCQSVFEAYGAQNKKGNYWCPIRQHWLMRDEITVAHIVRCNITELAATHLFGQPEDSNGHIWSIQNGLPMSSGYDKMLDDAAIAIVPTQDRSEFMVTVLDQRLLQNENGDTGEDEDEDEDKDINPPTGRRLDGRILKFRTAHRPSMRYLYFTFAANVLRRQRYEAEGWWRDRIRYAGMPFFATPGKWVNETALRRLANRVGHLPPNEAKRFVLETSGMEMEDPSHDSEKREGDVKGEFMDSLLQHGVSSETAVSDSEQCNQISE